MPAKRLINLDPTYILGIFLTVRCTTLLSTVQLYGNRNQVSFLVIPGTYRTTMNIFFNLCSALFFSPPLSGHNFGNSPVHHCILQTTKKKRKNTLWKTMNTSRFSTGQPLLPKKMLLLPVLALLLAQVCGVAAASDWKAETISAASNQDKGAIRAGMGPREEAILSRVHERRALVFDNETLLGGADVEEEEEDVAEEAEEPTTPTPIVNSGGKKTRYTFAVVPKSYIEFFEPTRKGCHDKAARLSQDLDDDTIVSLACGGLHSCVFHSESWLGRYGRRLYFFRWQLFFPLPISLTPLLVFYRLNVSTLVLQIQTRVPKSKP